MWVTESLSAVTQPDVKDDSDGPDDPDDHDDPDDYDVHHDDLSIKFYILMKQGQHRQLSSSSQSSEG